MDETPTAFIIDTKTGSANIVSRLDNFMVVGTPTSSAALMQIFAPVLALAPMKPVVAPAAPVTPKS